jgi:hypothetical protein
MAADGVLKIIKGKMIHIKGSSIIPTANILKLELIQKL